MFMSNDISNSLDLIQFFITQPEIVPDLMKNNFSDLLFYFFFCGADIFYGFLVDNDNIRRDIPVERASVFEGNAMIMTQNRAEGCASCFLENFS